MAEKRGGMTLSGRIYGWPCILVVALCIFHLIVALMYILYSSETIPFLPYFSGASFNLTSLPTNLSLNDNDSDDVDLKTELPSITSSEAAAGQQKTDLQLCPETPPHLVGPLKINFSHQVSLEMVQSENPEVEQGGRWQPRECTARHKVAIIIPFRHREQHLKYWLYFLHPILQRQQLDYRVYIINQYGETTFNRGKLMNVGYKEARKQYDYSCFVFSDIDIVPMNDRNLYRCYSQPRHLSVAVDKFGFRLPYPQIFGGVSALSTEQFEKINGYPNNYWGWGGEDDDVSNRLSIRGMSISRPDSMTGRCRMIKHQRERNNQPNPKRFYNLKRTMRTIHTDGLNSLQYHVVSIEKKNLYTFITVDIGRP